MLDELERRPPIIRVEPVDLVDGQHHAGHTLRHQAHELPLGMRERLAGVQHEQRGVNLRQKVVRGLGVVRVDRADAGRVDEIETVAHRLVVDLDAHQLNVQAVLGIAGLRHVPRQLAQLRFLLTSVAEAHEQPLALAGGDHRHDRGQRKYPGRQQLAFQQGVDERALASLELAEHDEVDAVLEQPPLCCPQIAHHAVQAERFAAGDQLAQPRREHAAARHTISLIGQRALLRRSRPCLRQLH